MVPIDLPLRIKRFAPAFRQALAIWLSLVVALLAIFHQAAWDLVRVWWTSATYGHGFLIVPIVGYLIWQRRCRISLAAMRPSAFGAVLIGAAGMVWLAGHLVSVSVLQHFALVGMLQASVLTVFGWSVTRSILFPLLYLLLAVPFGDFAVAPLQDLTAVYTVELLRLTDVPVYLENWRFVIPGGAFLVAEACAGVRYVLACFALGLLICDLMLTRWWKWAIFIALSLFVPIVANVVRAYGIVMLAYLSDFEVAVGVDHLIYGGVFLGFVTLVVILFGLWLRDRDVGVPFPAAAPQAHGPATPGASRAASVVTAGIAAIVVLTLHSYGIWATSPPSAQTVTLAPTSTVGPWQRLAQTKTPWRGTFPGSDTQGTWSYSDGGDRVDLFVAYYRYERPGAELVSSRNRFAADAYTQVEGRGRVADLDLGDVPRPAYLRLGGDGGNDRRIVWYWYKVGDALTHSSGLAKLHALKAKLLGGATSAAAIAIATRHDDEARQRLAGFAAHLRPGELFTAREHKP